MASIHLLPPSVINKIAAGEVVERPASVVKELMENAIDAGARRIDVTVEQGGCELIRVTDDGCGIEADQLPLAVASHATSKIQEADDLFRIRTLGFRGEALASIGEVSRMRIASRTAHSESGAVIEVAGGSVGSVAPWGCPVGTTVEVRHLFFNTPVRRKFLRTPQTELGHIAEAFLRVALPYPHIHCTLHHGDRLVHDLPAVERWRDRLVGAFGSELAESLIWIECDEGDVKLVGYVADPRLNRANNRWQYFFLNGRFIRDRSLQHALQEAYRGLLMQGRFPVAFLQWTMPPELVDVNVHPMKLEVRFQDGARVYSQLLGTIRNHFLASDLTVRVASSAEPPTLLQGPAPYEHHQRQMSEFWGYPVSSAGRTPPRSAAMPTSGAGRPPRTPLPVGPGNRTDEPASAPRQGPGGSGVWAGTLGSESPLGGDRSLAGGGGTAATAADTPPPTAGQSTGEMPLGSSPRHGLQILNRYLVAETDEGLLVIDQHALHERILYEKLRQRISSAALEVQPLLVPEPVTLGAADAALALEHAATLADVGIRIEPFGGDAVLITAYPVMLANFPPAEVLRHAIEHIRLGQGRLSREQVLDELLHSMACKAAVKAGDRLKPEEISELLEYRELCRDAHHCPHGRPTALLFTCEELDKRFKRI